ncbi:MAG: AmmeMemoRadiSam system protein B [Ruminiclostridium sp.]|nr:AmmeMemoRadiSam system protein B [Ruminiclostridium sp.]
MMKTKFTAWVLLIVLAIVLPVVPGCNSQTQEPKNTDMTLGTPEAKVTGEERQTPPNSLPAPKAGEIAEGRVERQKPEHPLISCLYFDEASFRNAVSSASVFEADIHGLKAGIVPHHLLASTMIASFWKTASQQKYDLVVIIGPDHFRKGRTAISTLDSGFSTILGDVYTDSKLVNALVQQNFASVQPEVMESDHTISSHIPFISYYMPDTPILPLLVKGNCDAGKTEALSNWLLETVKDKKVLFVASMDFSHYLPLEVANEKDEYTEKALRGFDYEKIAQMTNDHLDSKPSALFLLKTMSNMDAKEIQKWDHSNSDIISKANTGYTTSYFLFGFFADAQNEQIQTSGRGFRAFDKLTIPLL